MSNWLDVRIKIHPSEDQIGQITDHLKHYFYGEIKRTRDHNAMISLGDPKAKFVWLSVRSFEKYVSIVGNTRVGIADDNIVNIVNWIKSEFPTSKTIELQFRDDGSSIFWIYKWRDTDANQIYFKKILRDKYPNFSVDRDLYTEATARLLSITLKNNAEDGVIPLDLNSVAAVST